MFIFRFIKFEEQIIILEAIISLTIYIVDLRIFTMNCVQKSIPNYNLLQNI